MFRKIHPIMRPAAYLFLFLAILSLIAVSLSYSYMNDAEEAQQSEKRAMRIWKNKIDESRQSNQLISEYEKSYLQLVKNNVVGKENRLSWFEALQSIANARGLSSVKYSVTGQKKVVDPKTSAKSKGLDVYRSNMKLDVQMLHEGDLFKLLNSLEKQAKGLFAVTSCNIEQGANENKQGVAKMYASCSLDWYTFKAPDKTAKGKKKGKA